MKELMISENLFVDWLTDWLTNCRICYSLYLTLNSGCELSCTVRTVQPCTRLWDHIFRFVDIDKLRTILGGSISEDNESSDISRLHHPHHGVEFLCKIWWSSKIIVRICHGHIFCSVYWMIPLFKSHSGAAWPFPCQ